VVYVHSAISMEMLMNVRTIYIYDLKEPKKKKRKKERRKKKKKKKIESVSWMPNFL
jgi:hypothetical protein